MVVNYVDVVLTPDEVARCVAFTDACVVNKSEFAVFDRKFDRRNSSYAVSLMGKLGEVAAARVFGCELDWSVSPSGDDGDDTVLCGFSCQIKSSTLPLLIFNDAGCFSSDSAVLVQLLGDRQRPDASDSVWRVWGVVSRKKFFNLCYERDFGYGSRLCLGVDFLTGPDAFLQLMS